MPSRRIEACLEVTPKQAFASALELWVPKTSSTSCDLRVFIDDAAKAIAPVDVAMI
jgi:hypothetical protein